MTFTTYRNHNKRIRTSIAIVMVVFRRWTATHIAQLRGDVRQKSVLDSAVYSRSRIDFRLVCLTIAGACCFVFVRPKVATNCLLALFGLHISSSAKASKRQGPWAMEIRKYLSLRTDFAASFVSILGIRAVIELRERFGCRTFGTGLRGGFHASV